MRRGYFVFISLFLSFIFITCNKHEDEITMDSNNEVSSFSFTTKVLENTPNLFINSAIGISV
jgi:hypothetical protein